MWELAQFKFIDCNCIAKMLGESVSTHHAATCRPVCYSTHTKLDFSLPILHVDLVWTDGKGAVYMYFR
jgi:hypothetical protein